jgi:hypothetical protein
VLTSEVPAHAYRKVFFWHGDDEPALTATEALLHLVLRLRRSRRRLPLHVARRIRAATFQRTHVVDYVALARAGRLAGGRAGVRLLKGVLRGGTAGDLATVVARAGRALSSRARYGSGFRGFAVRVAFAVRLVPVRLVDLLALPSAAGVAKTIASRARRIRYM